MILAFQTLVATTYSGKLAGEQMVYFSVLKRDIFEKIKDIQSRKKLAEQTVITYANILLTAMNFRSRFESDSVAVPDPHPCTKNILDFLENPDYRELSNCCQRHICRPDKY